MKKYPQTLYVQHPPTFSTRKVDSLDAVEVLYPAEQFDEKIRKVGVRRDVDWRDFAFSNPFSDPVEMTAKVLDSVGKDITLGYVDGRLIVTIDCGRTIMRKIKRLKKKANLDGFTTPFI